MDTKTSTDNTGSPMDLEEQREDIIYDVSVCAAEFGSDGCTQPTKEQGS